MESRTSGPGGGETQGVHVRISTKAPHRGEAQLQLDFQYVVGKKSPRVLLVRFSRTGGTVMRNIREAEFVNYIQRDTGHETCTHGPASPASYWESYVCIHHGGRSKMPVECRRGGVLFSSRQEGYAHKCPMGEPKHMRKSEKIRFSRSSIYTDG